MTNPNPSLGTAIDDLFGVLIERRREMPEGSYTAKLLADENLALKKIGEEATEVVMAAKDADHGGERSKIVGEVADLWFHTMIALAHYGLKPADVIAELERREGTSGIEEKAMRKTQQRESAGE